MKVLFMDWNSIGNEDVFDAFEELRKDGEDISLIKYPFDSHAKDTGEFESGFKAALKKEMPDFVLSFNYWPIISKICNEEGVKYAAWVYDNPSVNLFSYTLINPCNYVFLFDSQVYSLFSSQGFKNVYYLPLAAAVERYDKINVSEDDREKWGGEISFVGGLYTEHHNYYDKIEKDLPEHTRGYLEGLMRSQMEIYGYSFVEKLLTEPVIKDMEAALGLKPNYDGIETYEYLYGNYVINRKITSMERSEILTMIGESHGIRLYTRDKDFSPKGVDNRGIVDYYREMPLVFKSSDINLNITLRSIQKGIPLRAMDIMGCGGFLLTNYQEDMLKFFEPGRDFVYYEDRQDLIKKIDYYLKNDKERREIAANGHAKVRAEHSYIKRISEIIDIVGKGQ